MTILKHIKVVFPALLLSFMAVGCGDGINESQTLHNENPEGTGGVAVQLEWQRPRKAQLQKISDDCTKYGIVRVSVNVSNASAANIAGGDFECSKGFAEFNEIPAQSGVSVKVEMKDAGGTILTSAEKTGVTIAEGAPTAVPIEIVPPPASNAGLDRNSLIGTTVTLDGSASSDANGESTTLTYAWSIAIPAGSNAVLTGANSVSPSFTPDVPGVYTVSLVVNDGTRNSASNTALVTAQDAPTANAGPDKNTLVGSTVTLNGDASSDANGESTTLTYAWTVATQPSGSNTVLTNADTISPSFTPDVAGDYTISLIVNDGNLDSAIDTSVITATVTNVAPVANAGPDKSILVGSPAILSGALSSDGNGDPLNFIWAITTRPAGSNAALTGGNSVSPSFTPDVAGAYTISLVVNDRILVSNLDTMVVTATVENLPPVAAAGPDQRGAVSRKIALNGSGSSDEDPAVSLTYSWSVKAAPAGSTATLSNTAIPNPFIVPDLEGKYTVELVVDDGTSPSIADSVIIDAFYFNDNFVAHYEFANTRSDTLGISEPMTFQNVNFVSDYIELSGVSTGANPETGYNATASIEQFNYAAFTVFVDFNPRSFSKTALNNTIVVGGTSLRWFSLRVVNNNLELTLNDQKFVHPFPGVNVTLNEWHQIVASVNLAKRIVSIRLDEQDLPDVILPPGFTLDVIDSKFDAVDRKISFSNGSNANALNGFVDNLRVFNRALKRSEMTTLTTNLVNNAPLQFVETVPQKSSPSLTAAESLLDPKLKPKLTVTCYTGPDNFIASDCHTVKMNGLTYWAYSYFDNRSSFAVVAYDTNNIIKGAWEKTGARYLWKITIDHNASSVTFHGQGSNTTTMTFSEMKPPLLPRLPRLPILPTLPIGVLQ